MGAATSEVISRVRPTALIIALTLTVLAGFIIWQDVDFAETIVGVIVGTRRRIRQIDQRPRRRNQDGGAPDGRAHASVPGGRTHASVPGGRTHGTRAFTYRLAQGAEKAF